MAENNPDTLDHLLSILGKDGILELDKDIKTEIFDAAKDDKAQANARKTMVAERTESRKDKVVEYQKELHSKKMDVASELATKSNQTRLEEVRILNDTKKYVADKTAEIANVKNTTVTKTDESGGWLFGLIKSDSKSSENRSETTNPGNLEAAAAITKSMGLEQAPQTSVFDPTKLLDSAGALQGPAYDSGNSGNRISSM